MPIPLSLSILNALALSLWAAVAAAEPLRVATTNTLLADFVRAIGGDAVIVRALVPPTVSPSKYQLKPGDIREVSGDELFLRGEWEVWSEKVVNALEGSIVITRTIPIETGGIWTRPADARLIARRIALELADRRPAQASDFEQGLARLNEQIDGAHAQGRSILETHAGAPVTICQNGLKYLIEALDLRVASQLIDKEGDTGMATAGSPRRIAQVIDESRARSSRAVIYAPQLALEQKCTLISQEARVPAVKVPLLPGAMDGADTYAAMITLAARQIAAALEPDAAAP